MAFDADLTACAALVEKADPERFLSVMAAPVAARGALFALFAMNVEVSRAPWVTEEAMIAEMRLQWWRDALAEIASGGPVRRHQVVTPLARMLPPEVAQGLDDLVAVRRWDIYRDPFEDAVHCEQYINASAGSLLWAATRMLGPAEEAVVRDFGYAVGVANWLRAVPELEARHRVPLLDGTSAGVQALASDALIRLKRARAARGAVSPAAAPALLSGWQAGTILSQALREPGRVADGRLGVGPMRLRLTLMARAASGRW